MKVIKNRSNNEQLEHCEYNNTWISTYKGWTYGKFEVSANFESNCGAEAQFGLYYRKTDKNLCQNGCYAQFFHKIDCINNNYRSGLRSRVGQLISGNLVVNQNEVRLKSDKN